MAKYKVLINGQEYKVSMEDVNDYYIADDNPTEDIIKYRVELDENNPNEGTIYARIEKPSKHTLYLINQGRCYITINCRNFIGHSAIGYHYYGEWDPDNPHKTNPNWQGQAHSSGLGRSSYRFHKNWSLCTGNSTLLNNDSPIQIDDYNDIEIPIHFKPLQHMEYGWENVKGHHNLEKYSRKYENPYREEFYYDVRLALLSAVYLTNSSAMRVYQTKNKITRIKFYI